VISVPGSVSRGTACPPAGTGPVQPAAGLSLRSPPEFAVWPSSNITHRWNLGHRSPQDARRAGPGGSDPGRAMMRGEGHRAFVLGLSPRLGRSAQDTLVTMSSEWLDPQRAPAVPPSGLAPVALASDQASPVGPWTSGPARRHGGRSRGCRQTARAESQSAMRAPC
jgi:hypothetical protein